MLLQSARETQGGFIPPITGKKLNVKHIQVYHPWLKVTRRSIFSDSGVPIQQNTQEVIQIGFRTPERTIPHSREDVSLIHFDFHLASSIFFSPPSWASGTIKGAALHFIFFRFLLCLLILRKHLKLYK